VELSRCVVIVTFCWGCMLCMIRFEMNFGSVEGMMRVKIVDIGEKFILSVNSVVYGGFHDSGSD